MKVSRIGVQGLFACTLACGGDATAPPVVESIELSALCEELAQADCARLARCGLYSPFDEALCIERQRSVACLPIAEAIRIGVAAGSVSYFGLAAVECRAAVAARGCDAQFDLPLLALPACRQMLEVQGTEGQACPFDFACAEGFYCGGTTCPGTCRKLAGNNESCGFDQPCAPGLYCSLVGMRCLAQAALSAPCEPNALGNSCKGSYCDRSTPGRELCAPVRGRGSACDSPFVCAAGARCVSGLCSEGRAGDRCDPDAPCAPDLACVGGRCQVRGGLDTECNLGDACAEGLTCTSTAGGNLCRPLSLGGQGCGAGCYLSRCSGQRCQDATEDEAPCASLDECLPGRSCTEGRCRISPVDCR